MPVNRQRPWERPIWYCITPRTGIWWRKELYTEEGKNYYHGNLYVPEDLEVLDL